MKTLDTSIGIGWGMHHVWRGIKREAARLGLALEPVDEWVKISELVKVYRIVTRGEDAVVDQFAQYVERLTAPPSST